MSHYRVPPRGMQASMIEAVRRALCRSSFVLRVAVGALGLMCAVMAAISCGGTTGKEGLSAPLGDDASAGADVSVDAATDATTVPDTGDLDSGAFDVPILYADRMLPDVVAKEAGAGDGGHPWPNCPPFVPVDQNGLPTPLAMAVDAIPGIYLDAGGDAAIVYDEAGTVLNVLLDDAGRVVRESDATACGSYGWLGSTAADECLTSQDTNPNYIDLPPCNWCAGFGNATAGARAGDPLYDICMSLYECTERTGCGRVPGSCLCGSNVSANACDASGPCAQEELAAFQARSDPASIKTVLQNYVTFSSTTDPWYCAGVLNQVYNATKTDNCFPPADAGGD